MTAQNVIDEVRKYLLDLKEKYRYDDAEMLTQLTSANRQLAKDRSDLLLDAAGARNTLVAITTVSQTLIFDEDMLQPLAHYTSQLLLTTDSDDDQNMKLAGFHLNKYISII